MTESHVVSALKAKRAELAGRIEATQRTMQELVIDLDHIDASLRIFDPDIDLTDIRPKLIPAAHRAFRGEVTRIILDALRTAPGPLTTHDLAIEVLKQRGLNPDDPRLLRMMVRRVGASLNAQREKGLAKSRPGPAPWMLWEIAD
jgi:hypothetical protein